MTEPAGPLDWTPEGPRSQRFGDVYFSPQDGLAESRAVFLDGCGLPAAWAGRPRFVVGELGFGTGLNILALADLWRRTSDPEARLHIFSIEAYPLSRDDAARALAAWPQIADLAEALLSRWPGRARGFHRVDWPQLRITLDLAVMDVAEALTAWDGQADAWFLDGFAPALNPEMWSERVLRRVADRSAPGARAATFTVAGSVRRGLAGAGFAVEKAPGFGRKRERLEARLPGTAGLAAQPRVAVVGAGIAGVAAARALRALGAQPLLVDAVGVGAGASGNPAALVTPRLDAGLGPVARLAAQAFARAVQLYEGFPDAIIARGALQLAVGPRDVERFARIAGSGLFEPGTLRMLEPDEVARRLEAVGAPAALQLASGLVLEPQALLSAWAGEVMIARVQAITPVAGGWRLATDDGDVEAEAVILAGGVETFGLEAPLRPVRGQASWARARAPAASAWGGYVIPTRDGLLFGATHDRDDTSVEVRAGDHQRNLKTLGERLPGLAEQVRALPLEGRAALRATTPDHLPLAGPVPEAAGLYRLAGFGGRGFSMAPLVAEHVAALVMGAPSPLPRDLAELVAPDRFARRAARQLGRN